MRRLALPMALCVAILPSSFSAADENAANDVGFVSLFDGKSLEGWQGKTQGYTVNEGFLTCKRGGGGSLFTQDQYGDFVLRFEFRLTPGANNGIGIRTPTEGDPAYVGLEIQVLDDTAEKYKNLEPYQYHGSIYGVVSARRGHLKPVGEWNEEEIICRGRRVKVVLNGATIVDADLDQVAPGGKTIDRRHHPGLGRTEGHIGLLGHGDEVSFRNLRIKKL